MKKILYLILLAIVSTGCNNNNVYSGLLKKERELIQAFIQREGLHIVTEEPTEWNKNTYWKVPDADNFYFHLVAIGDTTLGEVKTGDMVSVRFKRYSLDEYADTLYNWTTQDSPEPINFAYNSNHNEVTTNQTCKGWQLAIKYMKYPKAVCKIICPSKLGFSEENNNVIPYGYEIKRTDLQIK
jgi:hypothetical protein